MSEIAIKGASGLGDCVYAVSIAEYYSKEYDNIYVMSDFPVLFEHLPKVKCFKHKKLNHIDLPDGRKKDIDKRFTYCGRKYTAGTTQFEDSYLSIHIKEKLEMNISWKVKNNELVDNIRKCAKDKKICILSAPYEPFGRDDEWGSLLRIKPDIMQTIVNNRDDIYFIQVGNKYALHKISNVDLDLIDKTSVSDLMDLVCICDFGISQIGNLLPICECMNKKNFLIFAITGQNCGNKFIEAVTPEKCVHYKKLNCSVWDNDKNALKVFNGFIN